MAKVALIADTHSGVRGESPHFFDNTRKSFAWFFDELEARNIQHIIHLGDIVDRRKYIQYKTAQELRENFLEVVNDRKIETHIIAGNHDEMYFNTHEVNALDELIKGKYKYISTYTTPEVINIDGLDIQLLPWITESNLEQSDEAIRNSKSEILMGHLQLLDFEMHRGSVCDSGRDKADFARFDRVYSGHFHHRSSNSNVLYIGAFCEYTWADYNDPRGFSIFDTETRQVEFIENPNKIFRAIHYDDVKNSDILSDILSADYSKYSGCYVKVIVAQKSNAYALDTLISKVESVSPIDVSVVENVPAIETTEETKEGEVETTSTVLEEYIATSNSSLDKTKMSSFMKRLYNDALALENVE